MTQDERLNYLLRYLLAEQKEHEDIPVPGSLSEKRRLLRSLMNVRPPVPAREDFLRVQDAYLKERLTERGITSLKDLTPVRPGLYLWQGDITTLVVDAIVNAANSGMTGCYVPCHGCIDNAIHTYAGVQLRLACAEQMARQGHNEKTGAAKLTPAFNLPCRYVIHTVGPIIENEVTREDKDLLASCYSACLTLAEKNKIRSIAFCCISTGEFRFPNRLAAKIAVETVRRYLAETGSTMELIFNVFKEIDYEIYRDLLGAD